MLTVIPGNDQNVITEYRYGPGGRLDALIAKNPSTGDQVTRYEYGTTLADSAIASNDLLRAEIYPDSEDSNDRVTFSYNRQGQRESMRDQNGTVHEYEYDLLGRQTADKVTTVAEGIDDAVLRIGQTYDVRGLVEKITSFSDAVGATPVNEVQNAYNSFGQLIAQYQEHDGAVTTSTTPKVEYSYEDGSSNTIRQTGMTYPSGKVLESLYDDTAADQLSRIRTLEWNGTEVCRYSYLSLGTFVSTDYLEREIKLDYALGTVPDLYAGFDRFGRAIDHPWTRYGTPSSSSSSSSSGTEGPNPVVRLKYGYDRASNRNYREDVAAQFYDKDFDELYEYDGMQRLKNFHRGRLIDSNTVIADPALQQGWKLDATGNWRNFSQTDPANSAQTLDQQRLANRVNEITQVARTVGPSWATPEYDRNGNMTVIPQPKEMMTTFKGTWDAWNRMVKLDEPDGSEGWQTLAEYQYDGQTWRTASKTYESGIVSETRHFYFTRQWQNIEERLGTAPNGASADRQFLWGQRHIDDLVLRDRDTDDSGMLDERLYSLPDGNWNVVAVINEGDARLRFAFFPFGQSIALAGNFSPLSSEWDVRFTGIRLDIKTDLYCVRNRYLSYGQGTWLSRDPVKFGGGSNNYRMAFVPNGVDPSGLSPLMPDYFRPQQADVNSVWTNSYGPNFVSIEPTPTPIPWPTRPDNDDKSSCGTTPVFGVLLPRMQVYNSHSAGSVPGWSRMAWLLQWKLLGVWAGKRLELAL